MYSRSNMIIDNINVHELNESILASGLPMSKAPLGPQSPVTQKDYDRAEKLANTEIGSII